jgi:hypothetical protein
MWRSKKLRIGLAILLILGGVAWWQRTPLLTWYYVRGLSEADEADREKWVSRVASLDAAAVPSLLACLYDPEDRVCANAGAALSCLAEGWGAVDPRADVLLEELRNRFNTWSVPGQKAALAVPAALLRSLQTKSPPASLTLTSAALLTAAEKNPELKPRILSLAGLLVDRVHPGQCLETCCKLADQGLTDSDPDTRVLAVQLTLHTAKRAGSNRLGKVVPLLRDPSASVRRAAVVALAQDRDAIADDDLLPLLHDADVEVQRLCETALRGRGLQETHILLGRLISDDRPAARLNVLQHLNGATDLEPGVWLRRLSQDPVPAVRAAAVRAALTQPRVDLRDRLRHMAESDPSPTVRQLAGHYLRRQPLQDDDE